MATDGPQSAGESPGGVALPPARLIRLHRHSLTNVLIVGGTPALRDQVGRAFHRESPLAAGPFVTCDCTNDQDRLRVALQAWTSTAGESAPNDLRAAEQGTLFLDPIEDLSPDTQRLLLALARRLHGEPTGSDGGPCAGRLVVGNPRGLAEVVAAGRFLSTLHDALDKVCVELERDAPESPR